MVKKIIDTSSESFFKNNELYDLRSTIDHKLILFGVTIWRRTEITERKFLDDDSKLLGFRKK